MYMCLCCFLYIVHCKHASLHVPSKSFLVLEAWDFDGEAEAYVDDKIDNFTIIIYGTVDALNHSNSLTLQGENGIANLTVNFGNLTTEIADSIAEKGEYFLYISR